MLIRSSVLNGTRALGTSRSCPERLRGRAADLLLAVLLVSTTGCGSRAMPASAPPVASPPRDAPFLFEGLRQGTFHSRRFDLSFALADGAHWTIDDHTTRWLSAVHVPSRSRLLLRSWLEGLPVGREHCLEQARAWSPELPWNDEEAPILDELRPFGDGYAIHVVARALPGLAGASPGGVRPPAQPASHLSTRFVLVGTAAIMRRCVVLEYESSVAETGQEPVLADRLVAVTEVTLASLKLDDNFHPTRQAAPASGR